MIGKNYCIYCLLTYLLAIMYTVSREQQEEDWTHLR